MTSFKQGDILLTEVKFSDGSGIKKRPVLVISNDKYNSVRDEIIFLAITSNTKRILPGDFIVKDWQSAGLLKESMISAITQTISKKLLIKKLGALNKIELKNCLKYFAGVIA